MGKSGLWLFNNLEKNKAWIGMIMVQLAYAGMSMFSKAAMDKGMNPYVFVVYRQAFATFTLAPFAFFLDRLFIYLLLLLFLFLYEPNSLYTFELILLLFFNPERTPTILCRTP